MKESVIRKRKEYLLKLVFGGHHEWSGEVSCSGGERTSGEDGTNGRR